MTHPRRQSTTTAGRETRWEEPQGELVFGGRAARSPAHPRETQRVVQLVTQGTSVEIVGVRWSGRSEILRQVQATLVDLGLTVLTVSGTGSPIPLEAVRVALPPAYRKATSDTGGTAAVVGDALVHYLSDGPSVMLVDDGDLLDEASWSALVSAHRILGRPLVSSTLRTSPSGPAPHRLVDVAQPVVQISLDELRLETLHGVLEERVEGTLSPAVSARIHTKSAGIPGLAVAMLDGAVGQGLVRRAGDQWVCGPELWSDDMRGAFESVLHPYAPRVRDAVELLSVAGTMTLLHAWVLLGREVVEELEGHGLVRLTSVGVRSCPVLGVHPPGIGDYFLHQPVSARRQRIVDDAVSRLTHPDAAVSAPERADLLARLRPEQPVVAAPGAGPLQHSDVPIVSRMFTEAHKVSLAAARGAWDERRDGESALQYLRLQLTGVCDPEEVERVLEALPTVRLDDPSTEVSLRYTRSRWLLSQGAPVDEVVRPLVEAVPEGFAHLEALDTLARAVRWEVEAIDASYADVLAPRAAGTGLDAQVAGLVLAACHLVSGRVDDAMTVLDAVDGELFEVEMVSAGLLRGLALYATGRFAETAALATEQVRQAIWSLDRVALAGFSYLGALAQTALGRLDEAQDALAVVLSSGILARLVAFAPDRAVLVTMSVVASRTGHSAAAASILEHADQVCGATDALPLGALAWAEAVAVAGGGDPEVAAATFAELVEDLRGRGYALAADTATMASLYLHFEPRLAAGFRARAATLGGPLYTAYLDARGAAYVRDPHLLETAARDLQRLGAQGEALRCFTLAARLFRDQGEVGRAAEARSSARAVTDELGVSGVGSAGRRDLGFTSRELEIIRLVAAGRSNSEIAEDLVLSTRTVESHLRNIRRKSGAVEREDIASFGRSA